MYKMLGKIANLEHDERHLKRLQGSGKNTAFKHTMLMLTLNQMIIGEWAFDAIDKMDDYEQYSYYRACGTLTTLVP